MFKNRCKLVALLLPVALALTGCWDSVDVSSLDLSTMVILDKKGDELSFTVEIAKISPASGSGEGGGAGGKKQAYLTGTGKDFPEARHAVDMQLDKPAFLGTVRTLILTERAADDLAEALFRVRENQEFRQKVNIAIIREEPRALIEAENEADQPIGFIIDDTIHAGQRIGHTWAVTAALYMDDILSKRSFLIQHIGLADKQIMLDGYSVFRDAKLVGFIPMEGASGLSYLLSDHPVGVYRLPGDGGYVTAEVKLSHREIKPSYRDGQIRFRVKLAFKATIQYKSDAGMFSLNDGNMRRFSDSLNQVLAQEVRAAIEQSQGEFQCDYLNFGEAFRMDYPDEFEKMDWSAEYLGAQIETDTSVDISVSDKIDIEES